MPQEGIRAVALGVNLIFYFIKVRYNYCESRFELLFLYLHKPHSPDCSEKPLVKKTYFFLVWQSDLGSYCRTLEKKVFEQKLVA